MSTNLVLENETDPVLWRGLMLMGALRQFFEDTDWGKIDYMVVDMPPGTGDIALTVFQSLPIEGIVIVSSPQDLVQMVVGKALNMAAMMNVPVIRLVENMAVFYAYGLHHIIIFKVLCYFSRKIVVAYDT